MLWKIDGINVFLDVSTYCNAGCPQCHRTSKNGLGKEDWLPLIRWDLETFKKAFPPEEIERVHTFKFCGTWGDPVMCKELYEMCEYIIANSWARISIDTNGSIRNSEWWWNLGVMCGHRLDVVFAIDGINQEMHEKYRRFTDLSKVLDNMEMLSQTRARAQSQTILFGHNQNYKTEIMDLVREHGSVHHSFVISDRFAEKQGETETQSFFINENGEEEYLERAQQQMLTEGKISGTDKSVHDDKITCRWGRPRNEIVVNPDGQVLPCCFHANGHYRYLFTNGYYGKEIHHHELYKDEYNVNLKKYNILHTPLSEIINSDWYQKQLPNSMLGDNANRVCERQCSNRTKKIHQIRSHHAT
jgi:MoaA/NifB/PqqE/SkfB family radical SAM enzyme